MSYFILFFHCDASLHFHRLFLAYSWEERGKGGRIALQRLMLGPFGVVYPSSPSFPGDNRGFELLSPLMVLIPSPWQHSSYLSMYSTPLCCIIFAPMVSFAWTNWPGLPSSLPHSPLPTRFALLSRLQHSIYLPSRQASMDVVATYATASMDVVGTSSRYVEWSCEGRTAAAEGSHVMSCAICLSLAMPLYLLF